MATVFWDSKGIILIDYKPAGTSVTGEYYASVIKQLRVGIKEKQRGKLAAGVLLLHDNAPVHVQSCTSGYSWVQVRAVKSPAIQSRPCPKWLLSVPKFEVPLAWNEISGRWAQGCYRGLVWGPNRQLLFQRHRLLKRKVGQMHWSKGGLYWKIMLKPSSNLWVKPRVLWTYWTPLVSLLSVGTSVPSYLSILSILYVTKMVSIQYLLKRLVCWIHIFYTGI